MSRLVAFRCLRPSIAPPSDAAVVGCGELWMPLGSEPDVILTASSSDGYRKLKGFRTVIT